MFSYIRVYKPEALARHLCALVLARRVKNYKIDPIFLPVIDGSLSWFLTLSGQGTEVQEYYDALVRRLVETTTVYDDSFKVKFKSGIEIEVVS